MEEAKTCENCKRNIPAVNFTIHSIHCARNIRMCPVCKEAVPQAELQKHHEKMHQMVPCKKCGESVCGTDLEDHVRDSCAYTMQICRYCNLELRRNEMPAHEKYCGARTEQCAECQEWVMVKYNQLHLDSNHGFIRLDDDPTPVKKETKLNNQFKLPKAENGFRQPERNGVARGFMKPVTEIRRLPVETAVALTQNNEVVNNDAATASSSGAVPKPKRTNNQPQINSTVIHTNKFYKNIPRGAIKKRIAPNPPANPIRDQPYYSAMKRMQDEERQRREQNGNNLAAGLPPVLTPAAKVEKLRKMDALLNRETEPDQSYKDRLNGQVWMAPAIDCGHTLNQSRNTKFYEPMSTEEFEKKFKEIQLDRREERGVRKKERQEDRFSQIKTSLRELRRGLNEITTPYNINSNADAIQNRASPIDDDDDGDDRDEDDETVQLPCEFCNAPVPLDELVQHQTGCRPDLAQLKVTQEVDNGVVDEDLEEDVAWEVGSDPEQGPVIPCEFCGRSLPVYLIMKHQERCGRKANLLLPD